MRFPERLFVGIIIGLAATGCSLVKENRESCPCTLEISVEGVQGEASVLLDGTQVATVKKDTVLECRVSGKRAQVMAVSGVSAAEFTGPPGAGFLPVFRIPEGLDSPPLRLGFTEVDTSGCTARARVVMHKEYCTLSLTVESPPGWGEPWWVDVRSGVAGFARPGPLEGTFTFRQPPPVQIRLPRQKPGGEGLSMDILMPDGLLRTFSLGNCMDQAGYDWTAPDLPDLSLLLSLTVTTLTLRFPSCTVTIPLNVVI